MVEALLGGTTVRYCVEEVDDEAALLDGRGAAGWKRWTTKAALLGGRGAAGCYDGCATGWKRWTTKVALQGARGLRC